MNLKLIIVAACVGLAGGVVAGGEFVNQRWEKYYAERAKSDMRQAALNADLGSARDEGIERMRGVIANLVQINQACQANFAQGTLLYETPPAAAVVTGIREIFGRPVNITPGSNVAPRWWIPAKIKPQIYGAAGGAVYFYVGQDSKVDGPYLPASAGGAQ